MIRNYYIRRTIEVITFYVAKIFYKADKQVQDPFFILSPGRSGSTLLRREVIKRTNCNLPPESGDCIPSAFIKYVQNYFKSWDKKVNVVLGVFETFDDLKYWNINVQRVRIRLQECAKGSFKLIIKELYDEFAYQYGFNKNIWGDKTPYLAERIFWLRLIFPNSKIVFLTRDRKDIITSRIKNFEESYDYALKRYLLAEREKVSYVKNNQDYLEVTYNDLVNFTDLALNKIIFYLKAPLLDKQKDLIFLGDDVLEHHNKLKKEISNYL